MFERLIESGPRVRQGWFPSASSFAVHTALFVLAIHAIRNRSTASDPVSPIQVTMDLPGSLPANRSSGAGNAGGVPVPTAPVFAPITIGPSDAPILGDPEFPVDSSLAARDLARRLAGGGTNRSGSINWLGTMDRDSLAGVEPPAALMLSDPVYPARLRSAGIEGRVTVEFVVGTNGLADSASIRVVATNHEAFGLASTAAVLRSRFRPGTSNGQPVRVRVRQMVRFLVK